MSLAMAFKGSRKYRALKPISMGSAPGVALLHEQAHHFPAFAHLRVVEGDFQVVRHEL